MPSRAVIFEHDPFPHEGRNIRLPNESSNIEIPVDGAYSSSQNRSIRGNTILGLLTRKRDEHHSSDAVSSFSSVAYLAMPSAINPDR